ncbi:MAG TPA: hypothetical protein VK569_09950 [Bacteroidota bacterium]|nr:hypothetical protein [Bacteroidota bacterium]
MNGISGVLILCILQMGCSSSSVISSFDAFNIEAEGRSVTIELQNGETLEAQSVLALPDSTHFWNVAADSTTVLPSRAIKSVVMTNHFVGFLEGVGVGAIGGGVAILIMGGASPQEHGFGAGADAVGMVLFGMAAGGAIGGIPGAIIGHSYEYQFITGSHR